MSQRFNMKAYLYLLYFILKGLKIYKEDNTYYLLDKKRCVLITKLPDGDIFSFKLNKKNIKIETPKKKGLYVIKNYKPYLCIFFT